MIQPAIHSTIDFTSNLNRAGLDFYNDSQRGFNLISDKGILVFKYTPAAMGAEPTTELTNYFNHSDAVAETNTHSFAIELEDSWILFYDLSAIDFAPGIWDFMLEIDGEIVFSECCEYFAAADLAENSIYKIKGYNDDYRYGYLDDTYPGIGFFKVRDLNNKAFGVDKVEFKYSYGRTKILRAENYIKTRLTFCDLTLYQQNLLKFLCNCQNLLINDVNYQLVSDFTEVNKDNLSEICDLQADFVTTEQAYFDFASTERKQSIKPGNIFVNG
jgi:hypothetical protein